MPSQLTELKNALAEHLASHVPSTLNGLDLEVNHIAQNKTFLVKVRSDNHVVAYFEVTVKDTY